MPPRAMSQSGAWPHEHLGRRDSPTLPMVCQKSEAVEHSAVLADPRQDPVQLGLRAPVLLPEVEEFLPGREQVLVGRRDGDERADGQLASYDEEAAVEIDAEHDDLTEDVQQEIDEELYAVEGSPGSVDVVGELLET